jgi:hypothetical protein
VDRELEVAAWRLAVGDLPTEQLTDLACAALVRGASDFEAAVDGFDNQAAAATFVRSGQRLVARLQAELGDAWHVEYMPEPILPPGLRLRQDRSNSDH